jgi:O-antigen/teichoic acid export membrane protein
MANFLKFRQGAGAGTAYIAGSFAVSGALTYVFQSLSIQVLGKEGYAPLALLWSATFLTVQVLWIGGTQTLGRYVAEREALGQDWAPVVASVRRWQVGLLAAFLVAAVLTSPLLTEKVFVGDAWITAAFIVAVVLYAPEYFRRGLFNGHRQPLRMGAQILAESSSRTLIAAVLLALGWGVFGPALAIVVAPVIGVLAVRPAPVPPPQKEGETFSTGRALRFAGPVLLCMAFAQALMNGGPILASLLDGTRAQVSVFSAALILTRIPQYVLSPAIAALLPRASRVLSTEGLASFDRFVARAAGAVALAGALMVGATWFLGEWGMRLFADFTADRKVLIALAAMAAFYILSETLNQALFALARERLAALGWFVGLLSSAICLLALPIGVVERVSYSLALGTFVAAAAQAAFYLAARRRPAPATSRDASAP